MNDFRPALSVFALCLAVCSLIWSLDGCQERLQSCGTVISIGAGSYLVDFKDEGKGGIQHHYFKADRPDTLKVGQTLCLR